MDPDAQRIEHLLDEVNEILKKREWPGVAFTLTSTKDAGRTLALGFTHMSMKEHMPLLMNEGGFRLVRAVNIIAGN